MSTDPFLWLEEIQGPRALEWVEAQNQATLSHFQNQPLWKTLHQEALLVLTDPTKLAFGSVHRGFVYSLYQDTTHKLGVWRRTPLANMALGTLNWEIVLDLDELSRKEGVPFFLNLVNFNPLSARCLIKLSDGGKDACIAREFDLDQKVFVSDGFNFPESKSDYRWLDKDSLLWSSSYTRPTEIGYASQIYKCLRGQKISEFQLLHEVPQTYMAVYAYSIGEGLDQKIFVDEMKTWDKSRTLLLEGSDKTWIGNPEACRKYGQLNERWIFLAEKGWGAFPSGSLLIEKSATRTLPLKESDLEALFISSPENSLQELQVLKNQLVFKTSSNLQSELWQIDENLNLTQIPLPAHSQILDLLMNVEKTQAFINLQSFTAAPQILEITNGKLRPLQKMNDVFNSLGVTTEQLWAKSKDGTMIPYFVVRPANSQGRCLPTLQYGYGGFMAAQFPTYLNAIGKLWIEKGGSYVLANIRGGSEFGTEWHQQALKENRMKCYEDFIAISEDLIQRGYTTPAQLGVQGRSNGGLLAGAVTVLRPDLYKASVIEVPLLDMIRYTQLPPGASWTEEYGDPSEPKIFEVIMKYSPYQNLKKNVKYPTAFIRTVRTDDRVHPGHARKMAALMQSLSHDCWFWEETSGGHGSHTVADKAFQTATVFAYLHEQLF